MKKIILGIVALVLLALAGGGGYGTWHFWSRTQVLEGELATVQAEKTKFETDAQKLAQNGEEADKALVALRAKAAELDAARAALSGGTAIAAVEAAARAAKPATPDHWLAVGAIRLLVKGAGDPEAVAAFDRALQTANWPASLRSACAAQAGIAATGRQIERSADCAKLPAGGATPAAEAAPAPAAAAEAPKP